jgi:hypothetical protein
MNFSKGEIMKKLLIGIMLLLMATISFAGEIELGYTWSGNDEISSATYSSGTSNYTISQGFNHPMQVNVTGISLNVSQVYANGTYFVELRDNYALNNGTMLATSEIQSTFSYHYDEIGGGVFTGVTVEIPFITGYLIDANTSYWIFIRPLYSQDDSDFDVSIKYDNNNPFNEGCWYTDSGNLDPETLQDCDTGTQSYPVDTGDLIMRVLYEDLPTCTESWQPFYTNCTVADNQTLYYLDANLCGTYDDLPIDNGTVSVCNFCTLSYTENSPACVSGQSTRSITYSYDNYAECCGLTGLPADCDLPANTTESCIGVHQSEDIAGVVIDFVVEYGLMIVNFAGLIAILSLFIWLIKTAR